MLAYFLLVDEVDFGVYLFDEVLHEQFEVVHFLSFEERALDCALAVFDADVDGPALGVEKGYYGL